MPNPKMTISEEKLDDITHAVSEALSKENITLNEDQLSILNDGIETVLFHQLGIEIS